MAANEYVIPTVIKNALKADYGTTVNGDMEAMIAEWWGWYTSNNGFYHSTGAIGKRRTRYDRESLHPARRVCREWAGAILDDDGTELTCAESDDVTELLNAWADSTRFIANAQRCLERAFATGTGAMALWFDVCEDHVDIRARRYDARMVVPVSWDDDGISECAFVSRASYHGKVVDQLTLHVRDADSHTYHVKTRLFDKDGEVALGDDILDDYDTGSELRTFAIFKPALDNVYVDMSPYGQAVFADAIGAIKGVDNAWDSLQRDITDTKTKIFMSEELFDVDPKTGAALPMAADSTVVCKTYGQGQAGNMYEVFSPDIRVDPLTQALDAAWGEVGDLCGFGKQYFRADKTGGEAKTAQEVISDNSAFARSIRKHENDLGPQLEGLLAAMLDCQRRLNGWAVPEGATVKVNFDDSVISDTATEKAMFMSEIAAGVRGRWEYRERFAGEDEATAMQAVSAIDSEGGSGSLADLMAATGSM